MDLLKSLNLVLDTVTSDTSAAKKRPPEAKEVPSRRFLHCVTCKTAFDSAWDLMVHVQTAHMINIYLLADSSKLNSVSESNCKPCIFNSMQNTFTHSTT